MVYIKKHIRQQVRERANDKCELCGTGHPLDIHHIIPWRRGGSNDLDNIKLLCKNCHAKQKISNRMHHGTIVNLNIPFTRDQYTKLATAKQADSWHDFILFLLKRYEKSMEFGENE